MVLCTVLRRASTSITPFTRLALGSGRAWGCSIDDGNFGQSIRTPPIFQLSQVSPILHLCTASTVTKKKKKKKKQNSQSAFECDTNLIRILDSEIKCALDSDLIEIAVDVPNGFPFKIEDNCGGRRIVLTREFEEETLKIEVGMPTAVSKDASLANDGSDENETETEPTIPLAVTVVKPNGLFLQFHALASPNTISVNGLSFNNSRNSKDPLAHQGPPAPPHFFHPKEDLRNAFQNYLETRGLTPNTANFLLEYMMGKDAKEYLRWLRSLKKLIVNY